MLANSRNSNQRLIAMAGEAHRTFFWFSFPFSTANRAGVAMA